MASSKLLQRPVNFMFLKVDVDLAASEYHAADENRWNGNESNFMGLL